jgi:hypothetical protein
MGIEGSGRAVRCEREGKGRKGIAPAMRQIVTLFIALICAVSSYPAPAAEPLIAKPLTTSEVDVVLATYQDLVAAAQSRGVEFGKLMFVSPRGFGLLGPYDADLRADFTRIAEVHGFGRFDDWKAQFLRSLAAHHLPYFRHAQTMLTDYREQITKDGRLPEEAKATLISQIGDVEPRLLATIAQAESDLSSVAPYGDRLEAIFPRPRH